MIWYDGPYKIATPVSAPVFSSPIPGVATEYLLTQDWQQLLSEYSPLALNTAHPNYATFYLVEEGPREDVGGGVVQWKRTYAAVPASHDDYETFSYSFIGYWGVWGINVQTATGRDRFTRVVMSKIVNTYWIANGTSQGGVTINSADDIPPVDATRYLAETGSELDVDFLADAPPFVTATDPTRTDYETSIGTAAWSIVAEPSQLSRWMGNIWQRRVRYVKPL